MRRAFIYKTDDPEERGNGEHMMTMYGYPNPGAPVNLQTCFPMTNLEYLMMLKIWEKVWPWLTGVSRREVANSIQQCVYTFNRHTNGYRDHHKRGIILRLVNGEENPRETPSRAKKKKGSSQYQTKKGSSVIVFTRCNQPMRTKMSYPSLKKRNITQDPEYYETSYSYQMRLGDNSISVLDAVYDDMTMIHSVDWREEVDEADKTKWWVGWVIRWMEEPSDFYADNCRIRMTKDMKNTAERGVKGNEKLEGNVFSR